MSSQEDKEKRSKRLLKETNAIRKQLKIAKAHGLTDQDKSIKEPHRMAKQHAMDCGNPECGLCGNPRHIHKNGKTVQELSFEQTGKWLDT